MIFSTNQNNNVRLHITLEYFIGVTSHLLFARRGALWRCVLFISPNIVHLLPSMLLAVELDPTCAWKVQLACNLHTFNISQLQYCSLSHTFDFSMS